MKVGYAVTHKPDLASYRLRVQIPARHMGLEYGIGEFGDITFFYKLGNPEIARQCGLVVFDVVNDHFDSYPTVLEMAYLADVVTVGSEVMRRKVELNVGRSAVVIDDPWESEESPPACEGSIVAWFGHAVNLTSLRGKDLRGLNLVICSNAEGAVPWSLDNEAELLEASAVVLMTGTNPGASSNRIVKALRAGRFVVTPEDCADAWRQFADFIWIGDIREGVRWAFTHREEACRKIRAGQDWVRDRFSPQTIGSRWGNLFASTWEQATSAKKDGPALTIP